MLTGTASPPYPQDPYPHDGAGNEEIERCANQPLGHEVVQDVVVRAIRDVASSPGLGIGHEGAKKWQGQWIEHDDLGFDSVPDEAPRSRRVFGEGLRPAELAPPAVDNPLPHLQAEPTWRFVLEISDLAQPLEQWQPAERRDR